MIQRPQKARVRISNPGSGVSSDSSHHPREVHLVRFNLFVAHE